MGKRLPQGFRGIHKGNFPCESGPFDKLRARRVGMPIMSGIFSPKIAEIKNSKLKINNL